MREMRQMHAPRFEQRHVDLATASARTYRLRNASSPTPVAARIAFLKWSVSAAAFSSQRDKGGGVHGGRHAAVVTNQVPVDDGDPGVRHVARG